MSASAEPPARRILVVDNYDSFVFNLVQYLAQLGAQCTVLRNDVVDLDTVPGYDGVLLSPGPGIPEQAGVCVELVRRHGADVPVLGVCLGLQAIAVAYGGTRGAGARAAARQDEPGAPQRRRGARRGSRTRSPRPATTRSRSNRTACRRDLEVTARTGEGSSWRPATVTCRSRACSSTPSRCSPSAATACSPTGWSSAATRARSSAPPASPRSSADRTG